MSITNNTSTFGDFSEFMQKLIVRFEKNTKGKKVFTTKDNKPDELWKEYLASFQGELSRQEHKCSCCKNFIRKYGSMVVISEEGLVSSPLFDTSEVYGAFDKVVSNLSKLIKKRAVDNVLLSKLDILGTKEAGGWSHFYVPTPEGVKISSWKQAHELIAEKKEDYRMVCRALAKFNEPSVDQAVKLLQSGSLNQSEKFIGVANWMKELHVDRNQTKNKSNVVWKAIAEAPQGFAHINGSVLGGLLEDIIKGFDFSVIEKRHNEKVHPLRYQRAQLPTTQANRKQAEDIVKAMGIGNSLARRYARLDELKLIWKPTNKVKEVIKGGVFDHLVTKDLDHNKVQDVDMKPVRISYAKFERTVLPTADSISAITPYTGNYCTYCTAVNTDAANIMKWSNPVNWYLYSNGSPASRWGVPANEYVTVTGISPKPNMWGDGKDYLGDGLLFVLDGCVDTNKKIGLALFPSVLISDLHPVRATIEQFSNEGTMQGMEEASAGGLLLGEGNTIDIKVESNGLTTKYVIDRLE
tara:strand:- start:5717 stop:7285 length:1569 start_codon:yes stop_codon:yes gene_type:complete